MALELTVGILISKSILWKQGKEPFVFSVWNMVPGTEYVFSKCLRKKEMDGCRQRCHSPNATYTAERLYSRGICPYFGRLTKSH